MRGRSRVCTGQSFEHRFGGSLSACCRWSRLFHAVVEGSPMRDANSNEQQRCSHYEHTRGHPRHLESERLCVPAGFYLTFDADQKQSKPEESECHRNEYSARQECQARRDQGCVDPELNQDLGDSWGSCTGQESIDLGHRGRQKCVQIESRGCQTDRCQDQSKYESDIEDSS